MGVVTIIERITNLLMSFVVRQEAIDKKDEKEFAIFHYGIEICIASIVNIMLILGIGILTNTLIDSILFLMVFVPIRQCTGGFHAETYFICNLTMAITYSVVVLSEIVYMYISFLLLKNKKQTAFLQSALVCYCFFAVLEESAVSYFYNC